MIVVLTLEADLVALAVLGGDERGLDEAGFDHQRNGAIDGRQVRVVHAPSLQES